LHPSDAELAYARTNAVRTDDHGRGSRHPVGQYDVDRVSPIVERLDGRAHVYGHGADDVEE